MPGLFWGENKCLKKNNNNNNVGKLGRVSEEIDALSGKLVDQEKSM